MPKFTGFLAALALACAAFAAPAAPDFRPSFAQDGLIPGQYIVQLKKPAIDSPLAGLSLAQQASQLASAHGGTVLYVYEHALRGFAVRMPEAAAMLLAANPLVAKIEQDQVFHAIDTQASPPSYGIDRIDQRSLPLDNSFSYPASPGAGAHVYVIDTGLNASHSEFAGRVDAANSRNFVSGGAASAWQDCHGHGTHVMGTAAGTTFGIAKNATLHAIRVLDCQGSGAGADIIAGIDWVASNHQSPAVANMSLGTRYIPFVSTGDSSIDTAVRNLVNSDVAVAVAAGNDSTSSCNSSPAREPAVLTVSATTITDAQASYSNFGTCTDLYAPGDNIVSADYAAPNGGSTTMSGTSMASPHVTGTLAVKRALNPSLSSVQAQNAVVADTSAGKVAGAGSGSPNKLLYLPNAGGPPPVDAPPVASFTFSCTGLSCSFNGSGSTDDHGVAAYAWAFGDSTAGNGATVNHTYAAAGTYGVTLTVTDTVNQTNAKTQNVTTSTSGGGSAPCTGCTKYSGTLASGGSAYHPGTGGFTWAGGVLKGYLRGPAGTDFDLYLERYGCTIVCTWSSAASGETTSNNENVTYSAASGTYRWRVAAYSGSGAYDFWGEPK